MKAYRRSSLAHRHYVYMLFARPSCTIFAALIFLIVACLIHNQANDERRQVTWHLKDLQILQQQITEREREREKEKTTNENTPMLKWYLLTVQTRI